MYLDEDEVDEQVSSLKRDLRQDPEDGQGGLGLENANLKWNEVISDESQQQQQGDGEDESAVTSPTSPTGTTGTDTTTAGDEEGDVEAGLITRATANTEGELDAEQSLLLTPDALTEQPRFELRDIDVRFPEGKLTVVTGPTASGKTALLVSHSYPYPVESYVYIHHFTYGFRCFPFYLLSLCECNGTDELFLFGLDGRPWRDDPDQRKDYYAQESFSDR